MPCPSHRNNFHSWNRSQLPVFVQTLLSTCNAFFQNCLLTKAGPSCKLYFKCYLLQMPFLIPLINYPFFWTLRELCSPCFNTGFIIPLFYFIFAFIYICLSNNILNMLRIKILSSLCIFVLTPSNVLTIVGVQYMLGFNHFCSYMKIFSFSPLCLCPCCCSLSLGYLLPSPNPFFYPTLLLRTTRIAMPLW